MLNFLFLLEVLLICAAVYGIILLIKYIKGKVNIFVRYGSTDVLSEMGELRKDELDGSTGYEVRLTADTTKTVSKIIVKDEVGWIYLPRTEETYSGENTNYRKVGYVDADGYVYTWRKGHEPERIGYLAQPSNPTVPTIIGERNWKDLKWTSRLNVYYGDPEGWGTEEVETVDLTDAPADPVPDHNSSEKPMSQEILENDSNQPVQSQCFAATPPARRRSAIMVEEESAEEQPAVEPEVEVPVIEPEVEEPVAELQDVEEAPAFEDEQIPADAPVAEEELAELEEPVSEEQIDVIEAEESVEEPLVESVVEAEVEPVVESVAEPVVKSVAEPVEEPAVTEDVEPVAEPLVEPVAESNVWRPIEPTSTAVSEQVVSHASAPLASAAPVTAESLMDPDGFVYNVDEKEAAYLEQVKKNHSDVLAEIKRNMVKVEGGSFIMGVEDEVADEYDNELNEGPAHKVNLDTYCISKYPVTQKQWTAIMGYNNSSQVNDEYPIAPVDWNECMLFISRLNELTDLKFSLPTEAQWEFAARGGNKSNGYIYAGSNTKGAVVSDTHHSPVGKKKPNELGLYDMSGLVREWCSDWYVLRYPEEEQFNPMGPAMPEDPLERKHVVRSPFGNETVTNRKGELPNNPQGFKSYGFRLASETSKSLGVKVKPVLVGHVCRVGFGNGTPKGCPITNEARAGAYAIFYHKYGKNSYSEYLGQTPYGWKDTALLTSLVYSALFLVLYFVNTSVFQMPLLGDGIASIIVLTMFYFVLWGVIRSIKIEAAENGHSMHPILTLMNKTLGNRFIDIFIIILGLLSVIWTFLFYDADFIPLILAIVIGVFVNMLHKPYSQEWVVLDPMRPIIDSIGVDMEEETETELIPAPEGDVRKDYNWKLDSFVGKQIKAHIAVSFVQEEVHAQRSDNPFFLEKPNLTVADYKNYVRRMISELMNNEDRLLHSRFILQEIKKITQKNELNEIDTLQFVLDFIQESIAYELDSESRELAMPKEYIRYPDEILFDQKGDCDCKAFLAMVFYYLMGYDVIMLLSRELGHSAVAVSVKGNETLNYLASDNLDEVTVEINGRKYYYCETTTDGFLIGDITDGINVDKFETRIEWIHTEDEED